MLITSRQKRQNLLKSVLSLTYNDIDIRMSTCDKILGVYVDENLLWNEHFNHISKKLSTNLWLLSNIRSFLSNINYCSIVHILNRILSTVVLYGVMHQIVI